MIFSSFYVYLETVTFCLLTEGVTISRFYCTNFFILSWYFAWYALHGSEKGPIPAAFWVLSSWVNSTNLLLLLLCQNPETCIGAKCAQTSDLWRRRSPPEHFKNDKKINSSTKMLHVKKFFLLISDEYISSDILYTDSTDIAAVFWSQDRSIC